jgi:4'-phosphopantetheinyl transferase EntD
MLDGLLPPDVVTRFGDPADAPAGVLPEEEELVARAVPKRQREFRKARECARAALSLLGVDNFPLLTGAQREPLWPEGIVGSVTHTEGLCAVAVATSRQYRSLGIDVERDEPMETELARRVCREEELSAIQSFSGLSPMLAARLVFSAKESVYKCQFPLTRSFVGFHEVAIELSTDGSFGVSWRREEPLFPADSPRFTGRWRRRAGFLLTAVWLGAEPAAPRSAAGTAAELL